MEEHTYVVAVTVTGPDGLAVLERLLEAPGLEATLRGWRRTPPARLTTRIAALEEARQADARRIADLTEIVQGANLEKACYLRQASHQIKSPCPPSRATSTSSSRVTQARSPTAPARSSRRSTHASRRRSRRSPSDVCSPTCVAWTVAGSTPGPAVSTKRSRRPWSATPRSPPPTASRSPSSRTTDRTRRGATSRSWSPCSPSSSRTPSSTPTRVGWWSSTWSPRRTASSRSRCSDHGIGIPERSLSRVFAEDYRSDPAVKKYPDGVGTGSRYRPGDRRPLRALRLVRERGGTRQRVHGPRAPGALLTDRASGSIVLTSP